MSLIEYRGYRISVSAKEQSWGFSFGAWCGAYRVWEKEVPEPIQGILTRPAPSAYEAEKKALEAVKEAIDDAIRRSGEHLRNALTHTDTSHH